MASDEEDDSCMSSDMENSIADKPLDNISQQDIMSLEPKLSNMLNLKSQAHNLQRQLDHERSSRISAENKKKSLENDNALLSQKIEALSKERFELERSKIEMDSKFNTLQLSYTEESERKRNADLVITRLREQLAKSSEQGRIEMESKQKYEMEIITLRTKHQNLQKLLDQAEKEKNELSEQLKIAKTAWLIQNQSPDGSSSVHNTSAAAAVGDGQQSNSVQKLQQEKKDLEQEVKKLKEDLKKNDSSVDDTKKIINELENENKKLKSAVAEAEVLKKELTAEKTELAKVKSELEETDKKRKEFQRKVESGDDQATTLLADKDREILKLKNSNQTLQDKLKDKDDKSLQLETELSVSNASLTENKNKISDLVSKTDDLLKRQDELEEDCRNGKVENVRLQSKLEALEERCTDMKQERDNSKQQLGNVEKKLREAEQRALVSTTQKSQHSTAVEKLEEKLKEHTDERRHLVNDLEQREADKSRLERELREKEDENKQLKQLLQDQQLSSADQQARVLENERLRRAMDEITKELNETKTEQRVNKSASGEMKGEMEKLEQELLSCRRELRDKDEELKSALDGADSKHNKSEFDQRKKELGYQSSEERLLEASSNEENGSSSPSRGGRKSKRKYRSSGRGDTYLDGNEPGADSISSQISLLKAQVRAAKKHLKSTSDGGAESEDGSELSILSPEEREKLKRHAKNLMSELQQLQRMERSNQYHLNGKSRLDEDLLAEMEARVRMDLNGKLSAINDYLQQRADVCEQIDKLRENSDEELKREREAALSHLLQKNANHTEDGPSLTLADLHTSRNQHYDPTCLPDGMTQADGATSTPHAVDVNLLSSDSILSSSLLKELHRSISKHLEKCPQLELARAEDPMSIAARRSSFDELLSLKRLHLLT